MNLYIAEIDKITNELISITSVNTYDVYNSIDTVAYEQNVSDILLTKGYIYWFDKHKHYVAIDIDKEFKYHSEIQIVTEIKCLIRDNKLEQLIK